MLGVADSASAQSVPTYRAHAIPKPSTSTSGTIVSRAFALNDDCEVVGEVTATLDGVTAKHAFPWVPITRYGLTGQTTKDLNEYFTLTADKRKESAALDINAKIDPGSQQYYVQIAGRLGASPGSDGQVWQPNPPSGFPLFIKLGGETIIANAINNAGVAAGQMTFTHPDCGAGFDDGFIATWTQTSTPAVTVTPLGFANDLETDAQDINNNSTARTIGRRYPVTNPPTCSIIRTPCQSTLDGAEWTGTGSPAVMTPLVTGTEDYALGNNDVNNSVGYSLKSLATGCLDQAVFRETATGTGLNAPVNLHADADSPLATNAESRAEALNEPLDSESQCIQVVGSQQVPAFRGQLWQREADGDWTRTDLNDVVWSGCRATPLYTVREAKDINEDGEIAVILDDPNIGGLLEIAGILVSVADLTTDGQVDGADSGQLLLQYNICCSGTPTPCTADFNCSGAVDGEDLETISKRSRWPMMAVVKDDHKESHGWPMRLED